jgi:hypothetical protein
MLSMGRRPAGRIANARINLSAAGMALGGYFRLRTLMLAVLRPGFGPIPIDARFRCHCGVEPPKGITA